MKNLITHFELPVSDFARAKEFYQKLLEIEIEVMDMGGILTGFFPNDGESVSGAIVKAEGYTPTDSGTTVYFDGGSDLQEILDKVEGLGGKVSLAKTEIGPDLGFYAFFLDTEGNRLALMSPA